MLDTTHPAGDPRGSRRSIDLERTLFISASKSGATLETRSHTDYFWERSGKRGACVRRDHRSRLRARADGGRARLPPRLRRRADDRRPLLGALAVRHGARRADGHRRRPPARERGADGRRCAGRTSGNPGYELGRELGTGWQEGRDKVCIAETDGSFGLWAEQLIAESTGQAGQGPRPGAGRVARRPRPPARRRRRSPTRTRSAASSSAGSSPSPSPARTSRSTRSTSRTCRRRRTRRTRCSRPAASREVELEGSIDELLAQAHERDYVCVQAFIEPNEENDRRIDDLVRKLRRRSGLVVTHGYGPRYLHSTGPAAQGRPEHRALPAGRRRPGRGARRSPASRSASAG